MSKTANLLANVIRDIELSGTRVELHIIGGSELNQEFQIMDIKVKDSGESLNMYKLAYPLINPSFLRRHIFRVTECLPFKSKAWVRSYGLVPAPSFIKEQLASYNYNVILTFYMIRTLSIEAIANEIENQLKQSKAA